MQHQTTGMNCQRGCWILAAGVGLLVLILLLTIGDWGWLSAIFLGALAFVGLGLLFNWLFCRDRAPAPGTGNPDRTQAAATASPAPTAVAPAAPAPAGTATAAAPTAPIDPTDASDARPDVHAASAEADAEAGMGAATPEVEAEPVAAEPVAKVKPTTPLKGQEELAQRKGEWKYEGGAASAATASETAPAPEAMPDYDGDGRKEGSGEGAKPETLTQAREGGADNLKEIKGVGPKLEQLLNSMGFYHFDQIANWTAEEEAWVNANLDGFKGRASRDEWVKQARILAAGGDTEFSKRVDNGDVY